MSRFSRADLDKLCHAVGNRDGSSDESLELNNALVDLAKLHNAIWPLATGGQLNPDNPLVSILKAETIALADALVDQLAEVHSALSRV